MNNGQMDRGNENPTQHLPSWFEENHEKTPVRLVGTGIWPRDLPNASLMHYHGARYSGGSCLAWMGVHKIPKMNLLKYFSI